MTKTDEVEAVQPKISFRCTDAERDYIRIAAIKFQETIEEMCLRMVLAGIKEQKRREDGK